MQEEGEEDEEEEEEEDGDDDVSVVHCVARVDILEASDANALVVSSHAVGNRC